MRRFAVLMVALATAFSLVVVVPPEPAQAVTISGSGSVYGGLYSNEFRAGADLNALASATGKRVTFGGTFHSINESPGWAPTDGSWSSTREILDEVWKGKATPFANLSIPASAASIASGAWDTKINQWASHVQLYLAKGGGRSLILAPLQEMNGTWTPYGCDPANFKKAYKRIVDILRARGMDETKVRFAFAPNGWTGCGGSISNYYPGDAYVDIIGISAYRWSNGGSVYSVMGGTVDTLSSTYPTKPIIIAQTAAWPSGTKAQWIRDMFSWAASHPSVVGVIYFNYNNSGASGETDWRVWIPPTVNSGWKDGMRSSSTEYRWPLTDWFKPGPLNLSLTSGVTLCDGNADCDSVAFQDSGGKFHVWEKATNAVVEKTFYFGNPGDIAFSGDWNCDGVDTPGLYRQSDGYVYLRNSNSQGFADITFFFGNPGDFPVAGDFDGDGCDTVSIYRPSSQRFYIINELGQNDGGLGAADYSFMFGNPGDKPFVGDFDGDGIDTVGLHRESTGLVYFRNSNSAGFADFQFIFGDPGDKIIAGDWDGDGDDTVAVYRPSNGLLYLRNSNSQGNADAWAYAGSHSGVVTLDK